MVIEKKKDATGEELSLKLKLLKQKLSDKMLVESSSNSEEVRTGGSSFSSFMSNRQD